MNSIKHVETCFESWNKENVWKIFLKRKNYPEVLDIPEEKIADLIKPIPENQLFRIFV